MSWPTPLIGFDLETTGVDAETARIVTAAIVTYVPGNGHTVCNWLSDVDGKEIPTQAAAVHGISTEQARAEGSPARDVVDDLTEALYEAVQRERPIVIMNARYDLTLLDRECRRHGVPTLSDRLGRDIAPVLDPLVLDKHFEKYRKGSRKLEALTEHYGITHTGAHRSDADALAAAEVVVAIANRYRVHFEDLGELHKRQTEWAAEQARSLRGYREKQGLSTDDIREEWPLVPFVEPVPVPHQPARSDDIARWLKARRDDHLDGYGASVSPEWHTLDRLLDLYRLHADTGTPLDQHVCEGGNRDDCGDSSHPF